MKTFHLFKYLPFDHAERNAQNNGVLLIAVIETKDFYDANVLLNCYQRDPKVIIEMQAGCSYGFEELNDIKNDYNILMHKWNAIINSMDRKWPILSLKEGETIAKIIIR